MQAAITTRMCKFCDLINNSKFLDWRLSYVDLIVVIVFFTIR